MSKINSAASREAAILTRVNDLAVRNQTGKISREEENELDSYIRIGRFLDLLSAKAGKVLKSLPKAAK